MTSSRIEGPVSLPPTICAPPDRSRAALQTAVGATRRPFCLTEQPGALLLIWRAHLRPRTSANLGQNRRLNVLSARPWGDLLHETKVVDRSPRRGEGGRPFWAAAKIPSLSGRSPVAVSFVSYGRPARNRPV
jgi:hypothetical protein